MQSQRNESSLASLPQSLHQQLERAQNLLAQSESAEDGGDHSLALVKMREGLRVFAAISYNAPHIGALVLLADMGLHGYEIETVTRIDRSEIVPRTFLGVTIGHDVVNVPEITRTVTRGRIF